MIVWTLLVACSTGPSVTTETTFVGHLVDHAGEPLPDVEVKSIEGSHRTDGTGHFAVPIEPPSRLVHFVVSDVYYQRRHVDRELGTEVEVALPQRTRRNLVCPPIDCVVSLTWRLDDTMSAKLLPKCTAGDSLILEEIPMAQPEGTCRVGNGRDAEVVPLAIDQVGATWKLREAGGIVTVEVRDAEGAPLSDCEVRVGDVMLAATGEEATYAERVHEPGALVATCRGRPTRPVSVTPGPDLETMQVTWSAEGPTAYVGSIAPEATHAVVRNLFERWDLQLDVVNGVIPLPALQAGLYAVFLSDGPPPRTLKSPEPINASDVMSFRRADEGRWVGRLNLSHDQTTGQIRTHLAPR